jgi:hypothetical protein
MQTHTIIQQRGRTIVAPSGRLARPGETAILRSMLNRDMAPGQLRTASRDEIAGWDEMQGYPDGGAYGYDVVGWENGAYGYGPDTVGTWYKPWTWGRSSGPAAPPPAAMVPWAPRPPAGPRMPGPPMLPPGAYQALQSGPRRLLSYMGLGSLSWTNSTTETELPMVAEPQAAFRGRRLVIAQAKSDGATGVLAVVSDPLTVSGMPQTPAPNVDAPVEMFEASTTYSMLDLQIATSATQITLGISVSAIPASGETVNVSAGLYGEWLR